MQVALHVAQYRTSFCCYDSIRFIKAFYLVHQRHIEYDFVEYRLAAAHQAGVATLWDDRQSFFIAILEDGRHLLVCAWLKHQLTLSLKLFGPVVVMSDKVISVCNDLVLFQNSLEK